MQGVADEDPIPNISEAINVLWRISGATSSDELTEVLCIMAVQHEVTMRKGSN